MEIFANNGKISLIYFLEKRALGNIKPSFLKGGYIFFSVPLYVLCMYIFKIWKGLFKMLCLYFTRNIREGVKKKLDFLADMFAKL